MRKKSKVELLMEEYEERFLTGFPTHFFLDYTDEELIETLSKCLRDGEPVKEQNNDELTY